MRTLAIAAALGIILQQPTFRSRVDLMRLDVSVADAAGQPVRDLRAEDFLVTLDGQPRRVTFARFHGPDDTPRPPTEVPVSVATNAGSAPGRVVILVTDLESINPGSEKPIFETAARLLDRLGPSDAVGLLAIPGPSVDLTREHDKVRDGLQKLRGWASPPSTHHTMSVREAEAFSIKDSRTIAEVTDRECLHGGPTCRVDLWNMVVPLLIEADRRTHGVVGALTSLFERIEGIPAPKSVVLLSAGLQRRQNSGPAFSDLERRAASAGISMSVVHIDQAQSDASRRGPGGAIPRADLTEGLEMLAGATDANFYFGIATAAGPFERIRNEIVQVYQLGVESMPADADDRRHRLKVDVKRPGVTVRARKEILLPKTARVERNSVDVLAQPVHAVEAPLAAATYMTRGEEPATLKVILLVELLDARRDDGPASYALAISKDGTNVFETADRISAGAPAAAIATQLAPGRYRLRAAVVDGAGRPGSLDMPILVGLRPVGSLQFSDLIVGSRLSGGFLPATRVPDATPIEAALELYSADPSDLDGLSVTLEARRSDRTGSETRVPAEVRKTALDRRRVAGATLPAAALSPGTWLIAAVVRRGDAIVGQVSRTLTVE